MDVVIDDYGFGKKHKKIKFIYRRSRSSTTTKETVRELKSSRLWP